MWVITKPKYNQLKYCVLLHPKKFVSTPTPFLNSIGSPASIFGSNLNIPHILTLLQFKLYRSSFKIVPILMIDTFYNSFTPTKHPDKKLYMPRYTEQKNKLQEENSEKELGQQATKLTTKNILLTYILSWDPALYYVFKDWGYRPFKHLNGHKHR